MRSKSPMLLPRAALGIAVLLAPLLATGIESAAGSRKSKVMVPRSSAVQALASSGRLELLEDYGGSMVLVRGSDAEIAEAEAAAGPHRGRRRIDDRILLRSRTIDPSQFSAPVAPLPPGSLKGRLEIVQFHGPVKESWLKELRRHGGARPIAYIPHNAYIVWVDDPGALAASSLPVQWEEPLAMADRLSPELTSTQDPVDVTVQIVRAGAHDAALEWVRSRALAIRMDAHDVGGFTNIRVTLPPSAIEEIARLPEVAWIEPFGPVVTHDERSDLITAGLLAKGKPLGPGYLSWLAVHGLDDLGGTIVDITDTGIDIGGTDVYQPGLKGRVAYSDDLTGEGLTEDCVGHGTNIAGIIVGGVSAGASFLDDDGYLLGLGVAPSARVGVTRIFDCAGQFFPGSSFTQLIANAYHRGARIGNNSWGGPGTQYNSIDAEYDALVRDADGDPSNGSQGFLPVFSSGNLGPNLLTIGWPAAAKNILSVGATENYRPVGADGCGTSNILADSGDHVLSFSSRGPTADGRFKPDLVAPGSHIQSLASTAIDYTGIGVCDPYYPRGQHLLNWSSGTSQAAAHATGAAVIAAEVYRREFGAEPSPAMLKAMLIGHAHDMGSTAQTLSNTTNRPNFLQGWGRADIGSLVEERARLAFDQQQVLTATGETATFDPIVPEDPSRALIVTLVWTDAPGTPGGWSFVNDLDLVVEADGVTYLGNVFDRGVSVPGGTADERNNVEMVVLPPGSRAVKITVEAANLAGDGVPSAPGETDQDFALHVTNARLATDAGFIEIAGTGRACGSPLALRLADRQLAGFGRTTAGIQSGSDRETVVMQEDPPDSGIFNGSISTAAGPQVPADAVLQAVDGQTVTASYDRLAAGTGAPQTLSATTVARCAPPTLSQIEASMVGDGEATIRWKTDRPADSQVTFGPGQTRSLSSSDPKLVTEHEVKLRGLAGCTFYTAMVSSTDAAGLAASGPASPLGFSTGPGLKARRVMLHDDMEALATRWTHGALSAGAVDDWELGHASSGPPGAFSGTRVWGTNLDGNYSVGADAALVSPPIDLRDVVGAELTFEHYYAINGGRTPSSANDGAWVEITSDGGATWAPIEPSGGYPDTIDEDNPYLSRTSRVYAGVLINWAKASFDLSTYSGHVVRIRFHFWQDPSELNAALAGWYIDDVEVTAEGICHQGRIALDGDEYGCSSRLTVTLSDSDLNLNQIALDTAHIMASSPLGQQQLNLIETGLSSGQFRTTVDLSPVPAAGKLAVVEGSPVSFTYADSNTGGGTPATATASAMVSDCTPPPPPTNVTAKPYGAGTIRVSWTPVDPASAPDLQGYRIWYDTDGSGPAYTGTAAFQGASPVRVEASPASVVLTTLSSCSPHFITVTSFDRFGNESAFAPEGFAIPDGSSPCAAGRLLLTPSSPGCRQTLSLSLSDANADPDPTTAGSVVVNATSPSHAGTVPVTLNESGPASGVFLGSLPLAPVAAPGALTALEGDLVSAQYLDPDDGRGQARLASAAVTVSDCTSPAISGITVTSRSGDRAVLQWTTDEPATSVVRFGFDPSLGLEASIPTLTTQHKVSITGLTACGTVYYTVSSSDARGNTATADDGGRPLHFGAYREVPVFADDFESGAPGWSHRGFSSATDEWELGTPAPGVSGAPTAAFSGSNVWGTDLDGYYENGADMAMMSPPMDLRSAQAATLTFKHWFDIFSSGPPDGFDDGGFVEVSIDDGATWTYVTPVGGYPDRIATNTYVAFGAGAYAGTSSAWSTATFIMDDFVGHMVRVRFHLVEDPAEPSSAPHAGWYIDDVRLNRSVACHDALLELDRADYSCDGDSASIKVFDVDLDSDPLVRDTAAVTMTSQADPTGETLAMLETGASTGLFEATVPLSSSAAPGQLEVSQNDTLVASYLDADDGSGSSRTVTATASVPDCTAPSISAYRLADLSSGSFQVEWVTGEAGDSRVLYGETAALGSQIVVPGSRTAHSVTVSGLRSCTKYYFTVATMDGRGNLARDDTAAGLRSVVTHTDTRILSEDFETGAPSWTHLGVGDTWQIGSVSGLGVAATAPTSNYVRPADGTNSDFVLVSPWINLVDVGHPVLTIRHSYDFPTSFQGDDGAWVEGWDGSRWFPLSPAGGYPGFVDPEAGLTGATLPAYAGRSPGTVVARFDLQALTARLAARHFAAVTQVRFHVFVESGIGATGAGWKLDDVEVSGDLPCSQGRLAFDRDSVTCSSTSAALSVSDRDLDIDPGSVDTVAVALSSTGGAGPLALTLEETAPASGVFRGEVPLSAAGAPGTLPVSPGDSLIATYLDADDGSGSPATVTAHATVLPCAPPVISRAAITPSRDGFVAQWATDRPATSLVTLQSAGGPALTAGDHRLVTSHRLFLGGAAPCASYTGTISSQDADGLRASVGNIGGAGGQTGSLSAESIRRRSIFFDDMEGPDPGWSLGGLHIEWQRGVPQFGPATAFSGRQVFATDLTGRYDGGTNSVLISPPIDLTGASSARLTFWHWYDIFADTPPNSTDDSAWVEVLEPGVLNPIYIEPIGGYPDTTDSENGIPMLEGTGVYSGQSNDWEKATFDLTPFAGKVINLRFRIWNDQVELLINGITGAGWYLDDVEVSEPLFCFPAPTLTSSPVGSSTQGGMLAGVTLDGTGFRPGARIEPGTGIAASNLSIVSSTRITFDLAIDPRAALGPRDLTVMNPDGQSATLHSGFTVMFNPQRADTDGSGRVDGNDLAAIAHAFGSAEGEARFNHLADLDGDGFIDGRDLALVAASFGRTF